MAEVTTRNKFPVFDSGVLEGIARVLADTEKGMTGTEIAHILAECDLDDVDPEATKWKRLFNALAAFQNEYQIGNPVIRVIQVAMQPGRHLRKPERHDWLQENLKAPLALAGIYLRDDAKLVRGKRATSVTDAMNRANRLETELRRRNVHEDVLAVCREEILAQNYFHTVVEAIKSITAKVRVLSGRSDDGESLVRASFSQPKSGKPLVAINDLNTETECGEQRGFEQLLVGIYGTIRNPLGHELKTHWPMTEQDATDILSTISLIHRKLDGASKLQ